MIDKNTSEPSAKKRLKEFGRKHRQQYPTPPVDENEPEGFLAGDPDKFRERLNPQKALTS